MVQTIIASFFLPFWLLAAFFDPARAECICACVDGTNSAICSTDSELPPACAPELCPTVNYEIAPVDPDIIEPAGTQQCIMRQVEENGRYVWRSLCE